MGICYFWLPLLDSFNFGSPRPSPRRRRSSAPHLDYSSPARITKKGHPKWVVFFGSPCWTRTSGSLPALYNAVSSVHTKNRCGARHLRRRRRGFLICRPRPLAPVVHHRIVEPEAAGILFVCLRLRNRTLSSLRRYSCRKQTTRVQHLLHPGYLSLFSLLFWDLISLRILFSE